MTDDRLSNPRYGLGGSGLTLKPRPKPDWWKALLEAAEISATAQPIVEAIQAKIGTTSHSIWRVGLTHDLGKRKLEWLGENQNCDHWSCWEAASLSDAQAIERHFINKGMKGGTGGSLSSSKTTYVYVF